MRELARDAAHRCYRRRGGLAPVLLVQAHSIRVFHLPGNGIGQSAHQNGDGRWADVGVMLLAALAAVVVAPICEEITFRLLLQGWLEKWEDDARLST